MPLEKDPGKVLLVDDDEIIRNLLVIEAELAGLSDFEILESADSALKRIDELEDPIAAILTDGLNGRWKDIVVVAKEARTPVIVVSGDKLHEEAAAMDVPFLQKPDDTGLGWLERTLAELQTPNV